MVNEMVEINDGGFSMAVGKVVGMLMVVDKMVHAGKVVK